jgi:hypothetical protein
MTIKPLSIAGWARLRRASGLADGGLNSRHTMKPPSSSKYGGVDHSRQALLLVPGILNALEPLEDRDVHAGLPAGRDDHGRAVAGPRLVLGLLQRDPDRPFAGCGTAYPDSYLKGHIRLMV